MTDEEWRSGMLRRMDNLEAGQNKLETGQNKLEARMATVETQSAVDEVHRVSVESRLHGIESILSRVMWLILGALVPALLLAAALAFTGA